MEQGAWSREHGAGSREQGAGSRERGAGSMEQGAGSREQGAGSCGRKGRAMILRLLIGIGTGACIGALVGYFGKCSSGACPLTANPYRGAVYGGILGAVFAVTLAGTGRPGAQRPAPEKDRQAPGATRPAEQAAAADALVHVNSVADFKQRVLQASQPCLADFYSDTCPPCRMLAPIVKDLAAAYEGRAVVCKVSLDSEPALAAAYNVRAIPTVIFFRKGEETYRLTGLRGRAEYAGVLDKMLEE